MNLDEAHEKLMRIWPEAANWVAVDEKHWPQDDESQRDYQCGNLLIRLTVARNGIFLDVAPWSEPAALHSVNLLRDHLEPAERGRWRLSAVDGMEFLSRFWGQLQQLFSLQQKAATIEALDHTRKAFGSNDYNHPFD